MQSIIKGVLFTVLLGFFTVAVAEQLSPRAKIDKHMIKAELLHDAEKYQEALKVMKDSVLTLTKEDSLKLPDNFYFKYALVALSADSFGVAKDSAKEYIKETEKEKGQPYEDALWLLNEAERQEKIVSMSFYDRFGDVAGWLFGGLFSWSVDVIKKFYVEAIIFVLFAVLVSPLVIWGILPLVIRIIRVIPPKFKNRKTISLIVSIFTASSVVLPISYHTYYAANYSTETKNAFENYFITNRYTQIDTSALGDMREAIKNSRNTIKKLLDALPDTSASNRARDSLLVRMDSLDACIDSHFVNVRARLIRIEKK